MARLRDEAVDRDADTTAASSSVRSPSHRPRPIASLSPSPGVSESSDKENHSNSRPKHQMGPPPPPPANKRRRTGDRPPSFGAQMSPRSSEEPSFDPHQDTEERQQVRKGLRDLQKDVHELGSEWLRADSTGLHDAIARTNSLFGRVKQTSDAVIDSNFLARAAELADRKTKQAALGDGSQGVDVDEFVNKCKIFMRRGDDAEEQMSHRTATQRRRRAGADASDDEDEFRSSGDAYNWAWLGSRACFPVIRRPCVPGFLLGPLSVQKRARAAVQRRARQQRVDPEQAVRPRELAVTDLREQEDAGVTQMCKKINATLMRLLHECDLAEAEGDEDEVNAVVEKNAILDNGGVSLFHFAMNPKSFGQTVENLFYVSFLIKDGLVGVNFDSNGMPSLHHVHRGDEENEDQHNRNAQRYQAVIGIDFNDWRGIVETLQIKRPLIEHRVENEAANGVGTGGWYAN